jgi:hypothetical protein
LLAGQFSLNELREDGSLSYWSKAQSYEGLQQDTYHAGFEIRALAGIAYSTGNSEFSEAAKNYFKTWLRDYHMDSGEPCFVRGSSKVIEVHSCAESLLCLARMHELKYIEKENLIIYAKNAFHAAIKHLWIQQKDIGYFASQKNLETNRVVNIPYIRWGEAWMLRAMSAVLKEIKK